MWMSANLSFHKKPKAKHEKPQPQCTWNLKNGGDLDCKTHMLEKERQLKTCMNVMYVYMSVGAYASA